MTDINEIKNYIRKYHERNKIVFFVGAGISVMSGVPSWSDLILGMAKEIGYTFPLTGEGDDKKAIISSDEYLKVPQMYKEIKNETAYLGFVKKHLGKEASINDVHRMIMDVNPYHIITTNYDELLENAADETGRIYSVINSDSKVASAQTQRYILKIHGDFKADKFVLKEEDYLNYEEDYKLINALMKSIMATNLVIFLGYGLRDYNIKLIYNWVKQVQKNTLISPVFINTGGKESISDTEIQYFEHMQIKVVDAKELTGSTDYTIQYKKTLEELFINNTPNIKGLSDAKKLDELMKIFNPINQMGYLRAEDIARLFSGSRIEEGCILNISGSEELVMLKILFDKKSKLSGKRQRQIDEIICRFENSGIEAIINGNDNCRDFNKLIRRKGHIDNEILNTDYYGIEEIISQYGMSDEELYNKAYDCFCLGRVEESRELYRELVTRCKKNGKWVLYYLSQVNLSYLNAYFISVKKNTSGFMGCINWGKEIDVLDGIFDENNALRSVYLDLPAEYQKYGFLQRLHGNYYEADQVPLLRDNYEVERAIKRKTLTYGCSKYELVGNRVLDAASFIYDNRLILSAFSEHKTFIKVAMTASLRGMMGQINAEKEAGATQEQIDRYKLDFQTVLIIAKNFIYKDWKLLTDEIGFSLLNLCDDDLRLFEEYAIKFMSFVKEKELNCPNESNALLYMNVKDEIGMMMTLIPYCSNSNSLLKDYIIFALYLVCDRIMDDVAKLPSISIGLKKLYDLGEIGDALIVLKDYVEKCLKHCIDDPNHTVCQGEAFRLKRYLDLIAFYDEDFVNSFKQRDFQEKPLSDLMKFLRE